MVTAMRTPGIRLLMALTPVLAACATLGPPAIVYSRADIAQQAFVDRREEGAFAEVFRGLEGVDFTGPDVGFAVSAQRIEMTWSARLADGPLGVPLKASLTISGAPQLNAAADGIDLADARVEQVKLPLMSVGGDASAEDRALGRLPLLRFDAADLNRDGILYRAQSVSLGTFGLRVSLAPK
jgi:hypothetical protein